MTQELPKETVFLCDMQWVIRLLIFIERFGTVVLVCLLCLLLCLVVDTYNVTTSNAAIAVIEEKYACEAPDESAAFKGAPPAYKVSFRIDGQLVSPTVSETFFKSIDVGDEIHVAYGQRNLTGWYKPTRIVKIRK